MAALVTIGAAAACVPGSTAPRVTPRGTLGAGEAERGRAGDTGPFRVVSASPTGQTRQPGEIAIVFSEPARALGLGPHDPPPPVTMKPEVKGSWEWVGTRAIRFSPERPLPRGTTFDVEVSTQARSLRGEALGKAHAFTFSTERPALLRTSPTDGQRGVAPGELVRLFFDQAVSDDEARRAVKLSTAGRAVTFDVRRPKDADGTIVELAPRSPLPAASKVEVDVDASLRGVEGPLTMGKARQVRFETYQPAGLSEVECARDGQGKCTPGRWVELSLATPVKMSDLRRAIEVEPRVKLSLPPESDAATRSIYLDGAFAPGRSYTIKLRRDLGKGRVLRDEYGQELARDATSRVAFGDTPAQVRLGVEGTYLESSQTNEIPVYSVNAGPITIETAALDVKTAVLQEARRRDDVAPADARKRVLPAGARNRAVRSTVRVDEALGGKAARGPVWVAASWSEGGAPRRETAVVQVTDLGITAKVSPLGGVVWVTRLSTGKPVAGAKVEVRDAAGGEVVFEGTTDEGGVMPVAAAAVGGRGEADRVVVARSGDDWAYRSMGQTVGLWRHGIDGDSEPGGAVGLVFTDRGVYRPTDTVHVKMAVRVPDAKRLTTPAGRLTTVVVKGPDGDDVARFEAPLSAFGTLHRTVQLPPGAKLGRYAIEAQLGHPVARGQVAAADENTFLGAFEVAEYRPSEFKVTAETDKPWYVRGDALQCRAKGAFLFGAPMAGAEAHTSLSREEAAFDVPGLEGFVTDDGAHARGHRHATPRGGELENRAGPLDAQGEAMAQAKLDLPGQQGTERVTCESEVTDASHQTFAASAGALVHPGEFYVGVRTGRDGFAKGGESVPVEVVAADPRGERRAGVAVKVELIERRWVVAKRAAGAELHSEVTIEDRPAGDCTATTQGGSPGAVAKPASCTLRVPGAGQFVVRATATDKRGNAVAASTYLYALGEGAAGFADGDDRKVELVPDRKAYKVGDTARVLIKSPFAQADALVTVEREGVISQRRVALAGSMPTVDVPVTEAMMPNAFVSVLLVRGRTKGQPADDHAPDVGAPTYRLGFASLAVDHDARRLRVAVRPSKAEARPGETVDVDVEVRDAQGKPVRGEVALYAADEGVLSLVGYRTPDPVQTFFAPRGLGVSTIEARDAIGRIARASAALGLDKGLDGGGGGDGTRRDLRQTALWEPALATDEQGHARARFKLPDGLTTYRLMAVAVAADDRFGSATGGVTTSKPLMVRPALPRVLRAGDRLEAAALVTSKGAAGPVTVELAADGLTIEGEASRQVQLAAGQTVEARFAVSAPRAGRAKITLRARGEGVDDAIEIARDVLSPTALEAAALQGDTTTAAGEQLGDLAEVRGDVGGLEIALASTALAGLDGGVEQLVEYPYGCTEQLTSRLVPLLPLRALARELGLALPDDVDAVVAHTVGKVLANQRHDGGFGLWHESSESSVFLTAYALWGLGEASRAGVPVRKQAIEAATRYLRDALGKLDKLDKLDKQARAAEVAFALDVLAANGAADAGAMARLHERKAELPLFARAQLLHAMATGGAPREAIDDLVNDLAAAIRIDGAHARVVTNDERSWGHLLDSSTRTSALALRALVSAVPKHPMAPRLATGLLADRRGGRWRTTQETAWALLALDAYRRAYEPATSDFDARVFLGDQAIAEAPFHDRSRLGAQQSVPMSALVGARGQVLAFEVKGQGHLFYEARLRFARKQMPTAPQDGGFFVERTAAVVPADALRGGKLPDPKSMPERVQVGDVVLVDVTVVAPSPRQFVVVDAPLPAGLEAIDTRLASTASWASAALRRARDGRDDDDGGDGGWAPALPLTRTETRDDRVVFFVDRMPAGIFHYRFLARATSIGRFAAPPARVEEMYTPETFGHTAGATLEVAAR